MSYPTVSFWCSYYNNHSACKYKGLSDPTVLGCSCSCHKENRVETFNLFVTLEDIKEGVRGSSKNCPLARALHRFTGNEEDEVLTNSFRINGIKYENTEKMTTWIRAFDEGLTVRPTLFTIPYANIDNFWVKGKEVK